MADSLTGVSPDNVKDLTVAPAGGRRLSALHQRLLQSDSIVADYRIEVRIAGTSADQLADELDEAVTSGEFTTLLQSNAAASGATGLVNATSDSIQIEVIAIGDDDIDDDNGGGKSSSDGDELSDGELAGIIIGSFFGFLLLVALLYLAYVYFFAGNDDSLEVGSIKFSNPASMPSPAKKPTQLGNRSDSRNSRNSRNSGAADEDALGPFMNQAIIDL